MLDEAIRMNVNFPKPVRRDLEALARESGRTMTEVLKDAIAREKYLRDCRRDGYRVLVERDGEARELVLL